MRATQAHQALAVEPEVLREYALLADGERGALVGPRGDIAWLCVPRWHDDAIFSGLIGGRGGFSVTPLARYVWGGYYEPGSLIWHSRWVSTDGIIESRDALAFPGDAGRAVLMRRIVAVDGDALVRVVLQPRAAFGSREFTAVRRDGELWVGRTGAISVRVSGARAARMLGTQGDRVLAMDLTVDAGTHHDLVLEISDATLPREPVDAEAAWSATEAGWQEAVPPLSNCLSPTETRHSYAVLRGLTSRSHGMVAAVTTSLPERAEAGRNYDYRYAWIRDQCYAGQAVAADAPHPLLSDAVQFVASRLHEHGPQMAPAYTVDGQPVPNQRDLGLAGYPGGYDHIGNHVRHQFQLDGLGECLLLFAAAARHDCLDGEGLRAADIAGQAVAQRWQEPDAGIWEIENRFWTHSRLICVAGLRAMAEVCPSWARGTDRIALADRILAETATHSLHPSGRWQRAPDDERLDGALLIPPLRGALPVEDPRNAATLAAYQRELTVDGYAFRFRHDERALPAAEGSFLLCGFVLALALARGGDGPEAMRWYERTMAACGPPLLYSEEYDPIEHQMRGNLPQAFVHALAVEASVRLADTVGVRRAPPRGT